MHASRRDYTRGYRFQGFRLTEGASQASLSFCRPPGEQGILHMDRSLQEEDGIEDPVHHAHESWDSAASLNSLQSQHPEATSSGPGPSSGGPRACGEVDQPRYRSTGNSLCPPLARKGAGSAGSAGRSGGKSLAQHRQSLGQYQFVNLGRFQAMHV